MPWCPVCKNEYNEGVTVCADCGAELVDSLKERKEVLLCSGEEALMLRIQKFLEYNDIPVTFENEDEEAHLYVLPKHERKAKQAVRVFLAESALKEEVQNQEDDLICADAADCEESVEDVEDKPDEEDGGNDLRAPSGVYRKKSEQADDLRSSGEVLLVFGILGCIAMILIDLGILPIRFGNRITMNVIMFALFLFFIGFGIYSLKDARKSRAEASDEDKLTKRIRTWVKEHLTAELVDEASGLEEEDADEIRFFKRTEVIKKKIAAEFQEAEEAYLDDLAETVYQELFE